MYPFPVFTDRGRWVTFQAATVARRAPRGRGVHPELSRPPATRRAQLACPEPRAVAGGQEGRSWSVWVNDPVDRFPPFPLWRAHLEPQHARPYGHWAVRTRRGASLGVSGWPFLSAPHGPGGLALPLGSLPSWGALGLLAPPYSRGRSSSQGVGRPEPT